MQLVIVLQSRLRGPAGGVVPLEAEVGGARGEMRYPAYWYPAQWVTPARSTRCTRMEVHVAAFASNGAAAVVRPVTLKSIMSGSQNCFHLLPPSAPCEIGRPHPSDREGGRYLRVRWHIGSGIRIEPSNL